MIDKIIKNNPDNNFNKELVRRSQSICEKYFWSLLCSNHWDEKGFPTSLNERELFKSLDTNHKLSVQFREIKEFAVR